MNRLFTTTTILAFSTLLSAQEIDIKGKNIGIINNASVTTANNNTYFGEQLSTSGAIRKMFTIVNTGSANLVLSGSPMVTVSNTDFTVTSMPTSPVLPGGSTSFEIAFDPSTNAAISGTVSIANNDANENPYTFNISGLGLASRTVRWVNNQGNARPTTISLNGDVYSTAATTYTNIQSAINAANDYDIVYVTNGRYKNLAEATSTNCVIGGLGQDPNLYININKHNLIITSQTGNYKTSSAKLIGYSLNITDTLGNITIQGLEIDSVRQSAIYNSDYVFLSTSKNSPNVRILNNKITNVRGHGIKTDTRSAFVIDRGMWEINGNQFENIGFYNGSSNCTGTLNTSAVWLGEAGASCEVKDNTITNAKWGGILCIGYGNPNGSLDGGVTISGNNINTTGNAGIQIGWTTTGGFYKPNNALVMNNYIANANISQAIGIAGITMAQSNIRTTVIMNNHVTASYGGLAIQVAGWQNSALDSTVVRFNNFCNLVAGSTAIRHIAGLSPNGLFGTGDNLFKYKFDNNYFGSPTGPTYTTNPSGTGEMLAKETGTNASYSINDFNFLPFSTSLNKVSIMNPGPVNGVTSICEGGTTVYSVAPVAGAVSYSWSLPNGWTGTSTTNTISATTNTTSGNVQVIAASSCGTTGISLKAITVNALPNVSASTSKTPLCIGETATLTATNASTFVWSNSSNGAAISISPTITTAYTVTGTDNNGCVKTATISQEVSACASVAEALGNVGTISIYPNPNNGNFTIQSNSDVKLSVTNQLSQVIKIISLTGNNNHEVSLKELANGIYFVSGENDKHVRTQKVIVNK
jgi:hypothetical protein